MNQEAWFSEEKGWRRRVSIALNQERPDSRRTTRRNDQDRIRQEVVLITHCTRALQTLQLTCSVSGTKYHATVCLETGNEICSNLSCSVPSLPWAEMGLYGCCTFFGSEKKFPFLALISALLNRSREFACC